MSQHSILNIQQISSRTFNNDPSVMQTSIEHFQRNQNNNFTKSDFNNMSLKKTVNLSFDEANKDLRAENEALRRENQRYRTIIAELQKGNGNFTQQNYMRELMGHLNKSEEEARELKNKYIHSITNLKETIEKNEMLLKQVARLNKKLKDSELNYSREQQIFQKSQNLISNLSITKSNYEIELVNMKDSLVILQKENKQINDMNQQYQEKLALISQEIQRLRGLLEKTKKENQALRLGNQECIVRLKKYQTDSIEQKAVIERLRSENRDLNNKASSMSLQLREFHQKISYKETILNDAKENQQRVEKAIQEKQLLIRQLQNKVSEYQKASKFVEQEYNKQKNALMQEIGKLRLRIAEEASSSKEISLRREEIITQHKQLIQQFNYLKSQYKRNDEERTAIIQQLSNIARERDNLIREKEGFIQELDNLNSKRNQQNKEVQFLKTQLLRWQQKFKDTEQDFKRYEQKQRELMRECQSRIDQTNQQRIAELNAKIGELNQCKYELSAKTNEFNQVRSQLLMKNSEVGKLREETTSQSTIFDNSRKDFDQKVREKTEIINELKVRLGNCEKLIEQNRRERDLIFQEKNSLVMALQKCEQALESKSNQLRINAGKIDQLSKALKQSTANHERKSVQVQNFKRIIKDNELVISEKTFKLKDAEGRIVNITGQVQRLNKSIREKETAIIDVSNKCKEYANLIEERQIEINSLRQGSQKLNLALSHAEQSKGNFQVFLREIDRLNQVVVSKQSQIKNLRLQLTKLIQKIDLIGQQQLKIVKILQAAYSNQSQKSIQTTNQFTELKEFISRISHNTNTTLKDLYQQSSTVINQLNRNQGDIRLNVNQLQDKIAEVNRLLAKKEAQIEILRRENDGYRVRVSQLQQSAVQQEEIFQKILELSRENTAVREQLAQISTQREFQIQNKNQSITHLQGKVNQLEEAQGRELRQLKAYIQQKEKQFQESRAKFAQENEQLRSHLHSLQLALKERQMIIADLQNKLTLVSAQIDQRMGDLEQMGNELKRNADELERYKRVVQQYKENKENSARIDEYERQIAKLQEIIEIKTEQIMNNNQSNEKLKNELNRSRHITVQVDNLKEKLQQYQLQIQQHILEKQQLEDKLKDAENAIYYLEENKNSQEANTSNRAIQELKAKNQQLEGQIKGLCTKLRQSEGKVAIAKQQVLRLSQEYSGILEIHNNAIGKLENADNHQREKEQSQERISYLEDQLQAVVSKLSQSQIQLDYLRKNTEQNKIFLHSYEYKTGQVEREYKKLKEVYNRLSNEYSRLQMKNHQFQIQLKKADILQQKIQVLNGEINRLSMENIDLNEEISECKLALGDESTVERRNQELMLLVVLLMAETESLRSRVISQQNQLKSSKILQLSRYRQ